MRSGYGISPSPRSEPPDSPLAGKAVCEFTVLAAAVMLGVLQRHHSVTHAAVHACCRESHRPPSAFFQAVTQHPVDQKHPPMSQCRPSAQATLSRRPSSRTSCVVERSARAASVVSTTYRAFVSADDSHSTSNVAEKLTAANLACLQCTHRYTGFTPSPHHIVNVNSTTTVNTSSLAYSCRSSSSASSTSYITPQT